ncbi:type II secretion system secretin GspD [Hyphobacterium marinum]|uniref:Type II secretion system secretin GspD n=1 Tax=Hyphobacterium marinum TaxID=3116574 RepID=A0ABU7LW03_9PROT|nr:type II secretion system secretin GspD [Hyphobacterium sp. Y6023]MEE2565732.1 type II secretion system secretin GspD [Hyphobacterium sp. Y6023]
MTVLNAFARRALVFLAAALVAACASPGPRNVSINPLSRIPTNQQIQASERQQGRESQTIAESGNGPAMREQVEYGQTPRIAVPVNQASQLESGAYTVSFADARVDEAAQTILGDLLDQPYLIDPRVQGRITASTPRPLSRDGLLALFEAALAVNNAAIVQADGVYRIMPAGEAMTSGLAGLSEIARPGWGVSVIPLRYVSANNMRQLMESVVTRPGALRADPARNLLIILGTAPERRNAASAAAAFDVDWMSGMSVAMIPLANASAEDVVGEVETLFQSSGEGASAGALRLQSIDRLNTILAVAASPALLDRVRGWVARLDTGGPGGTTLRTYFLENGEAEATADLLNQLFNDRSSGSGGVSPDLAAATTESAGASSSAGPNGAVRVIADPINNALLVLADPAGQALIQRALESIDRAPTQVLIDALIAEVSLNDTLRYGVQFFFETNGIDGVADSGRGGFGTGGFDANGIFPGFNFLLESGENARLAIDALSNVTDLTVVSSPSVMVLDNQTAEFQVGDEVPIVTRTSNSVVNPDSPVVNNIEFRDTGVILTVTPRVSSTGLVTLEIDQEVSNVSTTASTGDLTPTISTRRISSTVSVRSGQTIILGGLIDESRHLGRRGIPGVSRIPLIGDALSSTEITTDRTELLIFLTPRVVSTDEDAAAITEEIRNRMELLRPEGE